MPRQNRPFLSFYSGRIYATANGGNENECRHIIGGIYQSTISAKHCEENSLLMSYSGRYCTGDSDSNKIMPAHHCQAPCLQSATCSACNYNDTERICTLYTLPCPEANSNAIMDLWFSHRGHTMNATNRYHTVQETLSKTAWYKQMTLIIWYLTCNGMVMILWVIVTLGSQTVSLLRHTLYLKRAMVTHVNVCRSGKFVLSSGFPISPVILYHPELP